MSTKNQIVVPKGVRKQLDLRPGDRVRIKQNKDSVTLEKAPSVREELDRIMNMTPPSQIDAVRWVRELRNEWES